MKQPKNKLADSPWKQCLLDGSIIAACLILFALFPSNGFFQDFTKSVFFLAVIPILYLKIILKRNLSDFGINLENKKSGLFWAAVMLILLLALFYLLIEFTNFEKSYILPAGISGSFWIFMLYELVFMNILFFIQEFFFKGFVLSIFQERFSYWAIIIQSAIAIIPLLFLHKSFWMLSPMIAVSLFGGFVAWKNKSFFYSYILGIVFFILLDSYIIHLIKLK